jgi:tRNA nucleotidyltransferase (CCA-adding enzyme)
MPDYMFLLESRLSAEQRAVLLRVQELARSQDLNVYLTGGAVRDLISGMPIRDLDFTIEGNPGRMVHELEKGGARVLSSDDKLRHFELVFAGDVDGSISGAREDVYDRPGARPEIRWSTVMEDLRRRDFSLNAVAISLNPASRGLLLDPTNGLADLEKREVRALSIHAFTNRPVRLLRVLRYSARMGFKMESRTAEWFALALERGLHKNLDPGEVGQEVRQLGREENPVAILKAWEARELLGAIHPQLARRRPAQDDLNRLMRVRDAMVAQGVRPRLATPVVYYLLERLKGRESAAALRRLEFRAAEMDAIHRLVAETQKYLKVLKGRRTSAAKDAYTFISKMPLDLLAFLQAEFPNPRASSKIRNYLQKWRPLRASLPVAELDSLGVPRGPKFDKILEDLFELQLRGRGRTPPDRTLLLRRLAGIKEEPKKKPKEEKIKPKGKAVTLVKGKSKASGAPEPAAAAAISEPPKADAGIAKPAVALAPKKEPPKPPVTNKKAVRPGRLAPHRKVSAKKRRR